MSKRSSGLKVFGGVPIGYGVYVGYCGGLLGFVRVIGWIVIVWVLISIL